MNKCACGRLTKSKQCMSCYQARHQKPKRHCAECGVVLNRNTVGKLCHAHRNYDTSIRAVLEEESRIAPLVTERPDLTGDWMVCSDTHIPWHSAEGLWKLVQVAQRLKISQLLVAGDLIHADTISRYLGVGKTVKVTDELTSCGRVLQALLEVFTRIVILPGNHDQRVEKLIASLKETKQGRQALDLVAGMLGVGDVDDSEAIAHRYLSHFFGSDRVVYLDLPDATINGTWLVQHPGSVSRIAPQTERRMIEKHRMSVIQGHSHLWGLGFDPSGQDVAFNCGHLSMPEKWRYIRERPTSFPQAVQGFAAISANRLIPFVVHPKMIDPVDLVELGAARENS